MGVQAGREGHVALHHIPAGGQIVPFVVAIEKIIDSNAFQHRVFGAGLLLAVFVQIGDRFSGNRHWLHPLRHQNHILSHRISEIPLRHIVVFVVQIVFVIPADKSITFLDRVSGPLYLLPLLNSLGLYLAASIGIKGHRHICNGRRLICCKGRCRQQRQHHAAQQQDAKYSFLHWLFSSCSCGSGLSAPPFFCFSLLLSRKHSAVIAAAAAKETTATST